MRPSYSAQQPHCFDYRLYRVFDPFDKSRTNGRYVHDAVMNVLFLPCFVTDCSHLKSQKYGKYPLPFSTRLQTPSPIFQAPNPSFSPAKFYTGVRAKRTHTDSTSRCPNRVSTSPDPRSIGPASSAESIPVSLSHTVTTEILYRPLLLSSKALFTPTQSTHALQPCYDGNAFPLSLQVRLTRNHICAYIISTFGHLQALCHVPT